MSTSHQSERTSGRTTFKKRRAGVAIADQLLYSGTNFVLTVLVARSVGAAQFGAFSLVIATYLIAIAVIRGLTSETLMVRFSASDRVEWRRGATDALGASFVFGLVCGLGLAAYGVFTSGDVSSTALALGILFPGLVMQDYLRFAAISLGRPGLALLNDGVQAVVQFSICGALLASSQDQPWLFVGAWGVGAHVGALVALAVLKLSIRPPRVVDWLRKHHSLAWRYALDDLGQQGSQQAVAYAVVAVAGLTDTGALRGAQTMFNPPSILNMGTQAAVIPEFVRVRQRSLRRMRRHVFGLASVLGPVNALWGIAVLLCPDSIGRELFGATWANAQPLLVYFVIAQAASGLWIGPMAGLRALGAANRTLGARSAVIVLRLCCQLTGAIVDGAHGAALAAAIASPLQALIWWAQFAIAMRGERRSHAKRQRARAWQELLESSPAADQWNTAAF